MASNTDVDALARMRWAWRVDEEGVDATHETREQFVERFAEFAVDALADRWTVWIAEEDGEVVANIWVYRVPKVPRPGRSARDFGYMTNVYTVPSARDRGVGAALLAAVSAWAHELDLEMIIVWPSDRSVSWYERGGFAPSEELLELPIAGYEG